MKNNCNDFETVKAEIICNKAIELVKEGKLTYQEFLAMNEEEMAKKIDEILKK